MTNICGTIPETPMAKIHRMIHEASFAISEGDIEKGKKILAEADLYSHDHC